MNKFTARQKLEITFIERSRGTCCHLKAVTERQGYSRGSSTQAAGLQGGTRDGLKGQMKKTKLNI